MSTTALKNLTIEYLRGSVCSFSLPFDKGKKLTVVYGENGTGKTTICDALEFIGKGTVGSLENKGLGKTDRFWHSVGKTAKDVSVSLETGDSTCTATVRRGEVVVVPPEARPRVELWRRSQILQLIEARPADRYAAIRRFIDVSGVELSETSLRELIRNLKANREVAVARVGENATSIENFWAEVGKPGPDAVSWARTEATRDLSVLQQQVQAVGALRTAFQRAADVGERFKSAQQQLAEAETAAASAARALQDAVSAVAEGAEEMVGLLEAAGHFFERHPDPSACPLCESTERASGLSARVSARLHQFTALQDAKRHDVTCKASLTSAHSRINDLRGEAIKASGQFQAASASCRTEPDIVQPLSECPQRLEDLPAWLDAQTPLPAGWAQAENRRDDATKFISTLKRALDTYDANVRTQKEIDRLLPRLDRALEILEEERHKFTDTILARIAANVEQLYESVHVGEGLNKITLQLDAAKRASLDMTACFCGHDGTPPQAYFSQSHLDTLGLCVFLALAALDDPDSTILVLDDVLASVDEPHVERLIEMLYTQAVRFRHCIITTHYRPWKEKLRWGWLQNGQCQFVELGKWTTSSGLCVAHSLPDVASLRRLLADSKPDPQLVCAKAGVVLEAALDFLTGLYECRVPRRVNGLYTLGDLLQGLNKQLRQGLRIDVLTGLDETGTPSYQTTNLAPLLDELTRIAQARNVFGCHFNELSFQLTEDDAINFGKQVLRFMELLVDPDAGWPRSSKSGSYWSTAGETRRLHPLKQPS